MTQSKNGISSLNLSRTIGISANAALRLKHKLQHVMKEREESKPLAGFIQIDDSYLGGKSRGGKRGRGASGKTPFIAAVATDEKGHPLQMRFSQVDRFSKYEVSQWAKKHLMPYSLLGKHIQNEFNRLIKKKTGIAEAAWEADIIRNLGLEDSSIINHDKYEEAMAELKVIGMEKVDTCCAVSQRDIDSIRELWTVDSQLIRNIEAISGTLGIDLPIEK